MIKIIWRSLGLIGLLGGLGVWKTVKSQSYHRA